MNQAAFHDLKFCDLVSFQEDELTELGQGMDQYERCYIRNKIMPMLIKEGLKFAIQAKRKSKGLNELKTDDDNDKAESEIMLESLTLSHPPDALHDDRCSVIQKQLMPMLIKAGLKFAIQEKRRSKGLGELRLEPQATRSHRLTPDEEKKRVLRRERNRLAAAKCRYKKRERAELLEMETKQLEESNDKLKADLARLETEKKNLSETLRLHTVHCPTGGTWECEQLCRTTARPATVPPAYHPTVANNQSYHQWQSPANNSSWGTTSF